MKTRQLRVSVTVLATVSFMGLSFNSTSDVPDPHQLPPEGDAAELQDLARWMVYGDGAGDRRFHVLLPEDLAAAVTPRPREISLFQPGPDLEAQRRFLHGIPYGTAISRAAERHRVDGLLLAAIVAVESGFTPDAVSPRGAMGLMQVRPAVGEAYGASDLFDPYANVDVGSRYLGSLLEEYDGDLQLTLAAYNAGPAAVARYGGIPPYRETRQYVRKVLAHYDEFIRRAGSPNLLTGREGA
ncbi:MAG TPA: lytic transglycosylase domain-containing protein [Thermoanaerobaculia bacterium]